MTKQELTKYKAEITKALEGQVEDIASADSIEEVVTALEYLGNHVQDYMDEAQAYWDEEEQED